MYQPDMKPTCIVFLGIAAALVTFPTVATLAAKDKPVNGLKASCRAGWGQPLVAQEKTARAIAIAIISAHGAKADRDMELVLKDEGDHWVAFQSTPPKPCPQPSKPGCMEETAGGGMQMEIDKCSGAVSDAHYAK